MSSVIFCFIVKDGETYLERNLNRIIRVGERIGKYKIMYAENDSKDNTRKILEDFKGKNPNILGTSYTLDGKLSTELCNKNEAYNCKSRLRRLAYIRNLVLKHSKEYISDYTIMLDLDFIDFDEEQFLKMFERINNSTALDAIFGMSVIDKKRDSFYDSGAVKPLLRLLDIMRETKDVRVDSAFSGFGIYRSKSIANISYNEQTDVIEHITFNYQLKNKLVYHKFRPIYEGDITNVQTQLITFGNKKAVLLIIYLVIFFIIYCLLKFLKKCC